MADPIRIFISYSHDSEEHLERVGQLAARLRSDGFDAWIDRYSTPPEEGWPRWMGKQFAEAHFVVMVCSPRYAEGFEGEPGRGSGVWWEANLIHRELSQRGKNTRFIPVYFEDQESAVP